ncbi:MAG: Gfo/Idh/MocA family oxidoreductase, partial [Deltaproteobacteria bacterium]|nr:Gfo/Idh/MocA family oxidoreductase [Deltaproteobacteria bacterium]
ADIHPDRNVMWEREIKITVSRAGGPGSLDPLYEQKGHDFPVGQVRWTLKRNLEEFLRLVTIGMVDVKSLISHRFDIGQAESVYRDLTENRGGPYIGVVFQYDAAEREAKVRIAGERVVDLVPSGQRITRTGEGDISAGVIGAGLFGKAIFLPHLKNVRGIRLEIVATSSGHSSLHVGEKYGFKKCTTDYKEVTGSDDVDCVFILTPHRTHKEMVIEGIRNGKHVFVEKPLCVNEEQLREIVTTFTELREKGPLPFLMVGYNRRFSPHVDRIRQWLKGRVDPAVIHYRVNAGYVPPEHWVHAPEEGGSRVVGEVCH